MNKGKVLIKGKGEVVGNLMAASLSGGNVEFFSFGEYFEAKPLIEIVEPVVSVRQQIWSDGIAYNLLTAGEVELEAKLAAHGDTLVYVISNHSPLELKVKLRGGIEIFSWFSPTYRDKIAEMASTCLEAFDGKLIGSYRDTYFICIASNAFMLTNVWESIATYEVSLELNPNEMLVFTAVGASSKDEAIKLAIMTLANPSKVEEERREWIKTNMNRMPVLSEVKPEYELLCKYMWYVILSNRVTVWGHPVLKNPLNMPSKFTFRHQWLWDSAFHAIVLSSYDIRMAEEELLNLFEAQKPDGQIPHEIFLSKEFCKLFWDVDDYSPWTTQPPVLAIAVKYIADAGGDREFLTKAFNALDRYDRWFRGSRDSDADQLMAYIDYLESGWDNAVRWDKAVRLFNENPAKYKIKYNEARIAPMEAVDLNCLIYLQRKILAELAERLDLYDKFKEYNGLAEKTAEGIRKYMWNAETGFFYDILEENHEQAEVKSPAAFLTLYTGIASQEQAEKLVGHLFNPREFWTKFPLPTVSADDGEYDPKGYWRGRSWINILWFAYYGLKNYGFRDKARCLAEKALDIMAAGPTCNENYDSSTGEPLGAPDFGWSTLMIMILEDLQKAKTG